ncbi:uncharacterized protein LY89DRAFT_86535 [Mollisia scopiformis]|uniref:Uncharacterized protein n=1 Tax=Mollisia scopiformis TaxID=149040 RepID=A0A194X8V1_MOLSC|nr:uncharacterized protein LY89DRAFT_86535 [Mollisia scopiformis]KUJ16544.1 hypothetical protein LY89DRAFT_86535 [Mollisia scopiformis]
MAEYPIDQTLHNHISRTVLAYPHSHTHTFSLSLSPPSLSQALNCTSLANSKTFLLRIMTDHNHFLPPSLFLPPSFSPPLNLIDPFLRLSFHYGTWIAIHLFTYLPPSSSSREEKHTLFTHAMYIYIYIYTYSYLPILIPTPSPTQSTLLPIFSFLSFLQQQTNKQVHHPTNPPLPLSPSSPLPPFFLKYTSIHPAIPHPHIYITYPHIHTTSPAS